MSNKFVQFVRRPLNRVQQSVLVTSLLGLTATASQAALTLTAVDTTDATAVASWVITGFSAYFAVKASPLIVAWGMRKLEGFLGSR